MTKKKDDEKSEARGVDPAWLMTKRLGIGLAEAHARLAAEADAKAGTGNSTNGHTEPTTPAE